MKPCRWACAGASGGCSRERAICNDLELAFHGRKRTWEVGQWGVSLYSRTSALF